ncbi:tail fiber protein [Bacteroides phage B124-14]|uniref:tail fiber protein n=2 Tax=root TaxID=1 RepID=UPI0002459C2C|nr:tail fiber protein [Bacteroides phage B124-14]CCE45949.1 putative phage tail fibre protein [Bacteroides phage B124-14]
MEVHNNFSPLAFRKKESKATYEKWYAFGKNYAIPASANTLIPFQFTDVNVGEVQPDSIEVVAVNQETGEGIKTGVYVSRDDMPEHGSVLYVSPGKNSFSEALPQGTYRAEFSIGTQVYISTPFCVIPGIETSSKYLLIEYWNDEKIAYPGGFITTGANNDFKYQMYVPATICKPKYEFEEELTKRAGYKFLELQTSTKVYAFTFVAPEFICDAMRLIRLSDYIRISHDGEYYNALNFEFDVDWQEQLYLAAVDCQFETDSIIQKLPSFNRRDKASFYNALLANIDTPIMFSPDTVGLYYKEYRETEPVVKGKLIRELSPIDLIDENTTIAVDLGTGEARKFNLYRMLQDYISKSHEDATNFLLHLRGGATFGDDISGSAAHINSAGDARFNDVDADSVSADAVDAGSWLSVGNTAFTVNKSGKTDTGELTARGKAYLTEDVYTGGRTGTITKDGQLKYLSAIIQQFLSSPTFVSGFLGEGFKIWVENGNWHIECDNLTVRQTMNIFELLIQKIRSVNGALVVSQSNGKLSAVEEVGTQYKLTTGEEFPTFQEGDLVRCQTFAGYQGAGLTFDFTQFAKYDYSGGAFDSSLIDVTPDSISFNLNDTGNSGFAFYKFSESSPTPIEIPSFTLTLEGGYPGMMAFAAGLDSNDSPVEGVGVLLQNGDNVIPAIKSEQGIHNFAITITGDSGHGDGKVTVKQKKAAGSAPNNSLVKFYWVEVKAVDGASFFADKAEFNGVVPAVGDEVVQMGNTKNSERQALIYITAQESGHPYIEILNGVKTKSLSGTNRTRLGDLSNIQDSAFPEGQQPSGSGLYCDNAFLRGIFLLRNGKSVEDEVNQAKQDAANATTEAERAQQTAQEAKDRLNKWADDGFISPTEKPALIDEGKRIQAEFLQIKNNADKYAVPVPEYTKAYENYLNELRYHSAQQPEDIAVRPELAQSQTAYYDKRNGALNAIATASKEYVDNADKKLKEYLDTEITAIPGKIELAVRSLKTANYNLLADSNRVLNGNPYQLGVYRYETHLVVGKSYTLTVCYKCADSSSILAYNNAGGGHVAEFPKSDNETIVSVKISPFNEDLTYFEFYKLPQKETTQTYVKWAVITEGDIGVANWIPSRTESELNIGGANLLLKSGICVSGVNRNERIEMSKYWRDLRGKKVTISFDYEYSGLELGGNNRIGLEEAILKDGTSEYYYVGTFKYFNSLSPKADSGRFSHTITVPYDIVNSQNKGISLIIQIGNSTVMKVCNPQIQIGETATEWFPAPEDMLNESIKYTDNQILAVDGKIELTVKTKVENLGIGANNLFSYTSSDLNNLGDSYVAVEKINDIHGFKVTGENHGRNTVRIPNIIPPIPGKYTVSGWIKGSQSTTPGITIDVCDSASFRVFATPDNNWSYFKHTFDVSKNTEDQKDIYNFVDLGDISWAYIWVKDFKVEAGEIATAWSPNFQDAVYKGAEYTNSQISVVEGKITSTVEKINTVDGRVTGLASRVEQTEKSITSVVGDIGVINSTTNRHISKRIDLRGWDNNKFFPLVISIPVYHKTRVEISRPLAAVYGKPSYGTHDGGFSMNLTFEMSGSGWGSLPAVTNIFDYTKAWTSAGAKIVVDLGQITETSTCRMGIRGGSMYDVTVDDTIDPNVINVYQTDYHGSYNTSFPVRTDGTEPVRTYGYYTEIKQTQESIALTANKVDDQGRRLSAAELTLSSDHAKLSVVEQTANSANSLAGTANNKADIVDGRVTATQNGLVETGINITSRKIILKADNLLFQNNTGQQTAAINANGKLTANSIEVGEVVAGGFAAQRITTGNLTVTDGAVIAGMTISGGVLTGKNIHITDGAKIGNFTIESGILSANGMVAGMQMRLSNNLMEISSSGLRIDHNSGGYAINVTGNGRCYMQGVESYRKFGVYEFAGATQWKAPGVHFACTISSAAAVRQKWGNPSIRVSAVKHSTGRYTVRFTGVHSQGFIPMVMALNATKWVNACVEDIVSTTQFTVKLMDVNTGMIDSDFAVYICGFV